MMKLSEAVHFLYLHVTSTMERCTELLKAQQEIGKAVERLAGLHNKLIIEGKVASKMAERAYSLGGSAVLGVSQVQKALSVTKPRQTVEQATKNRLILEKLAKEGSEALDFLEPTLSEEERDILEDVRKRFNEAN
jgi:Holliday junction resolvase